MLPPECTIMRVTRYSTCRFCSDLLFLHPPLIYPLIFVSQIINEGMLEDVNNILNSGDVPNLYGPEEMDRIMTACRPICVKKRIAATKLNVFAQVGGLRGARKK